MPKLRARNSWTVWPFHDSSHNRVAADRAVDAHHAVLEPGVLPGLAQPLNIRLAVGELQRIIDGLRHGNGTDGALVKQVPDPVRRAEP